MYRPKHTHPEREHRNQCVGADARSEGLAGRPLAAACMAAGTETPEPQDSWHSRAGLSSRAHCTLWFGISGCEQQNSVLECPSQSEMTGEYELVHRTAERLGTEMGCWFHVTQHRITPSSCLGVGQDPQGLQTLSHWVRIPGSWPQGTRASVCRPTEHAKRERGDFLN